MLRKTKVMIGIPILAMLLWIGSALTIFASGSFSVSGGGTVAPGSKVSITVSANNCEGVIEITAGGKTTEHWLDKSVTVNVTAPSTGEMTVTVNPKDLVSFSKETITGSKSVKIVAKAPTKPEEEKPTTTPAPTTPKPETTTPKPETTTPEPETTTPKPETTTPAPTTPKPEEQKPATTETEKPKEETKEESEEKPKEVEKSDDNRLSELTAGQFKLSPAFRQDTYEYSLGTITSKEVKIQAKASDGKAKVAGTGTKTLVVGENVFNITVTAENGKKQVYKISAKYEEPKKVITHKFDFKGQELTVPTEPTLSAPDGFEEVEIKLDGQKIQAWENKSAGIVIVDMQMQDKTQGWYRVEEDVLSSTFQAMGLLGENLYLVDIVEEEQQRDGMQFGQLKVDKKAIPGWLFLDVNLENYYLIPALDAGGKQVMYLYEKTKNNMVLFTDNMAVSKENYANMLEGSAELESVGQEVEQLHAEKVQYQIVIVAVAVLAVFFLVCAILCYVLYIKKKNTLRRLNVKNRAVSSPNENSKDYPRYTMEPINSNKNKKQ